MYSVNLDSIQDFSQIPVKLPEKNSGDEASSKSDFLAMLNENLNKAKESETVAPAEEKPVEKIPVQEETSETPCQISKDTEEKSVEKNSAKEIAKDIEQPKAERAKEEPKKQNVKIDSVLQSAVFAKAETVQKGEVSEKGIKKAELKTKLKSLVASPAQNAEAKANPAQENIVEKVLPQKEFLIQKKEIEGKNFSEDMADAQILSANEILMAMQASSQEAASSNNFAQEQSGNAEPKIASLSKAKKETKFGVIEVKDLRTKIEAPAFDTKEIKKDFVKAVKTDSQGRIELTMDLGAQSEKNILALDSQSAAADGSTFQAMLKNQITQNAADFVRAGNIVLKDNNVGSINLVLHPEELGNVKINLELTGKVITGHISVASREALNAFGNGADVLRNAFIQSGFEDAHFDVSFAGSEMQFAQNSGNQDNSAAQHHGRKIYGEFVEENVSAISQNADSYIESADYSVNIVA